AIAAAAGLHTSLSAFSRTGSTVNAGTTDRVGLRKLYINSLGGATGIDGVIVGTLNIDHCVVAGFSANAIRFVADDGNLLISDSTVRGTDGNCIWVDAATAPRVFIVNTNIQSATSSI